MTFPKYSSRSKGFWILGFPLYGMICLSMFRLSIGVLIPEVASEFSLSDAKAGTILSAYLVSLSLCTFIGGYISDKVGRRVAMSLGLAILSAGLFLNRFTSTFSLVLLSMFISGIGAGLFIPGLYAYVGEALPSNRGLLGGVTNSAYAFGGFFGPIIFGFLSKDFEWRISLLFFGVIILSSSALIWGLPSRRSKKIRMRIPFKEIFTNRRVVLIALAMMVNNIGFVSSTTWIPKFLIDLESFTIVDTGIAFGLYSLLGGVGAMVLGWFSDRFERGRVTAFASIAATIISLFYFQVVGHSVYSRLVFTAILGFFFFAYWNLSISSAQDNVNPAIFGSVTGFVQNIALAVSSVAPILSGSIISILGISQALILTVSLPYFIHGIFFIILSMKRI